MSKRLQVNRVALAAIRSSSLVLSLFLFMATVAWTANAAPPQIVTFDPPGAIATVPVGLTLTGTVVGYYFDGNFVAHGFLRTPSGQFTSFDAPGAGASYYYINGNFDGTFPLGTGPLGTVVGYYNDANDVSHCFIRTPNGEMTTFDAPGADTNPADHAGSQLNGISPLGLAVGLYTDSNFVAHGFVRKADGHFTSFDAAPGAIVTYPNGPVNAEGSVVGFYLDSTFLFHGFVRSPDGKIATFVGPGSCDTGTPSNCYGTGDLNINIFGWSVGAFQDDNFVHHAFLRSPDGKITVFDAPGAGDSGSHEGTVFSVNFTPNGNEVAGLNDLGMVAATYLDANNVYHGFLRTPDGKFTSFDAPGADLTPGDLNGTFPFAVNDLGVVTGIYTDANYLPHGFLREP